ncbi:MAG TPA: hypothetical protein VF389_05885, partial [Woeseiaceae bacterium]
SSDGLQMRARLRLSGKLDDEWQFGGRLAARLDTRQENEEFWLRWHTPVATGLLPGQATIDELYLDYGPAGSPWSLRMGRFQASFGLADVMKKSLDQNDSPNFDINWTDGAWLKYRRTDWTAHTIVRHNDRRGPSSVMRPPLNFADDSSRVSLFLALESTATIGPLVQRMVSVTWLPGALRPLGIDEAAAEDYFSIAVKSTAEWALGSGDTKFRLGAEIGFAPNTPRRAVMASGVGDAETFSWQTSFNLIDFVPHHNFAVVYGRVADGWLISGDFRPNDSLVEARWVWRPSNAWQFDARVRRREEMDLPAGDIRSRRSDDIYLRATWRW